MAENFVLKRCAAIALLLASTSASAQQAWDDVPRGKHGEPYPERLPYRRDRPIPAGYRVDKHLRDEFLIAGGITFGATYLLTFYAAVTASHPHASWLYVPVVGPYVFAFTNDTNSGRPIDTLNWYAGLVAGGLQLAGVGLFAVGFIPKTELVRNDIAVRVVPVVTLHQSGLSLVGTF